MSEEHAYGLDNIKEQDNKPPTWLIICWIGLLSWGFFYLVHFWTLPGDKEKTEVLNAPITYKNPHIEGFISGNKDKTEVPKATVAETGAEDKLLVDGKTVYEANCSGCHGMQGDGNGPAAAALTPKPRNFIKAQFKYGSDDASLTHTIMTGVKGTAMPSWKDALNADQIKSVLAYIHTFAPNSDKVKLLAEGKVVYESNCATCHGLSGDGNGPAAATLNPKPRNFKSAQFKYGSDDDSLLHTIHVGVKGTAMPSWKNTFSPEQFKSVLAYVHKFKK